MARIFTPSDGRRLDLPGRISTEILSGRTGARGVTLRRVEIPVALPGEPPRPPHRHRDFEECIFVLSGQGTTESDSGEHRLRPGDTLLVPPGEAHVTRNTGQVPLILLCFFPVADAGAGTEDCPPRVQVA